MKPPPKSDVEGNQDSDLTATGPNLVPRVSHLPAQALGTRLRQDPSPDGSDDSRNGKGWKSNNSEQENKELCTCSTILLHISLPSLHEYDLKMPNFTFFSTRAGYVLCQNSSRAKSNEHRRAVDKTNIKSKPTGANQFWTLSLSL